MNNLVIDDKCISCISLECSCLTKDHRVRVWYDRELKVYTIEYGWNNAPFWKRFKMAINFLLGKDKYQDDMILRSQDIPTLIEFLTKYDLEDLDCLDEQG